jgi:GalNAc-alpha-(1->4)-GalNAc-alpha-(1->3)-diNAcBac-PP-undecaprenol alpha-1,4-N-acetyl-D-galactosaminyltransferase
MTQAGSRLTLVISSLQPGGAERVMAQMASYWAARGRDVTLLSFDRPDAVPFYTLHPAVRVVGLDLIRPSAGTLDGIIRTVWRVARVRRALVESRPDAIISFLDQVNVVTLLATRGLRVPVIVSERSHPGHAPLKEQWVWLRARTYPWAKWVVVQTPEARDFFTDPRVKTVIVPNIIKPAPAARAEGGAADGDASPSTPWITAVGRLGPEKGFDLLLAAFAKIAAAHPDWRLRIVGGGPLAEDLARQSRELGLQERVQFTGRVSDVFPLLAASELFVMSSRFEGFPNALGEAMAAGLPVVSFDCPSGPRALIRHGVDGVLVPPEDVDALANAIERLIQHPAERAALAGRAIEVTERFSEEAIMKRWDELLELALSRR